MNKKGKIFCLCLLTACIITSFGVSATFAKFVSKVDITDEARVAKWGLNVTHEVDLFKDSYTKGIDEDEYAYVESLSSCAANRDPEHPYADGENPCYKVIAPGTEGKYTFTITGKPETNYRIIAKMVEDSESSEDYEYAPKTSSNDKLMQGRIIYTFSSTAVDDVYITNNLNELISFIENIYIPTKVYPAGEEINDTVTIKWVWAFSQEEYMSKISCEGANNTCIFYDFDEQGNIIGELGDVYKADDKIDTGLGEKAQIEKGSKGYDDQATLKFAINISAVQTTKSANANQDTSTP